MISSFSSGVISPINLRIISCARNDENEKNDASINKIKFVLPDTSLYEYGKFKYVSFIFVG